MHRLQSYWALVKTCELSVVKTVQVRGLCKLPCIKRFRRGRGDRLQLVEAWNFKLFGDKDGLFHWTAQTIIPVLERGHVGNMKFGPYDIWWWCLIIRTFMCLCVFRTCVESFGLVSFLTYLTFGLWHDILFVFYPFLSYIILFCLARASAASTGRFGRRIRCLKCSKRAGLCPVLISKNIQYKTDIDWFE